VQFCVNWINWIVSQTPCGLGSSTVLRELASFLALSELDEVM
jgi:hypothetical protein